MIPLLFIVCVIRYPCLSSKVFDNFLTSFLFGCSLFVCVL